MAPRTHQEDEGDYGGPTYAALASSESERLAKLRARLADDASLDAREVSVTFQDGALHLSGVMHDEKAWFALVNVAGTFAPSVVDEIAIRRERP